MGEAVPVDVTRLGRYQVLKHLATGGMAEVLLACVRGPFGADHVVIKRVRRDQATDPQFVKMFMDEATLAALLHHPNIVKVHEIGNDLGEYFFAMEYVHGEDLRRVLMEVNRRRDKLPIALITGIVAAAAAGLDHAHRQVGPNGQALGIVHRDVSPANILVGYDGRVKVADFGIAKAALRTVETRSGTLKGKVSYMSPEQVTGAPVDRRSDVFALGIVLYEVATARRLFKGDNDFLTMSAIVQGNIPLPSVHRPDLPRILEDIIMKALSPAPKDRFQSAEELRADLEKFTHAIGMRMSNESVADYMRKLFGHRPEPWLVDEFEPTQTTTIDFDGSASGIVHPPQVATPNGLRAEPSSLIMMSRGNVPTDQVPTIAPPGDSGWIAPPTTATGSGQLIDAPQSAPKSRRRLGIVIGMAAVAAIAGAVLVLGSKKSDDGDKAPQAAAPASEPARDPEPTPAPAAAVLEPGAAESEAARMAREGEAANAEHAAQSLRNTKESKVEAARIAKEEAAAKAAERALAAKLAKDEAAARSELAAQTARDAKAAKLEAARLAKDEAAAKAAERAQAAKLAKDEAAAKAAERAQAAKLARAEKAKADAAKAETVAAAKTSSARPAKAATKPRPKPTKSTAKWNPNELFPE